MGQEQSGSSSSLSTEWVSLAKVGRPFGVKGWVHVHPINDMPDLLLSLESVNLLYPNGKQEDIQIKASKAHGVSLVMNFEGPADRDIVKRFTNAMVRIRHEDLPSLAEGEYYWVDMVGCDVHDAQGQQIGVVDHFFETGAHQVIAIMQDQTTVCAPFIMNDTVVSIDLESRRIVMDWPFDA